MITETHLKKTFSSFKIRNYRFLWTSDCLQAWAEYMELVVLSWLILEMSSSPLLVGLYGALRFMGTIMSPAFGVIVDRFDRKLLLILVIYSLPIKMLWVRYQVLRCKMKERYLF